MVDIFPDATWSFIIASLSLCTGAKEGTLQEPVKLDQYQSIMNEESGTQP